MSLAHFKALNVDSSDESDSDVENPTVVTREALEEKAVSEYREILSLVRNKQWEDAKEGLIKLLESDVLSRVTGNVKYVEGKLQPSLTHLKYCILVNLGHVESEINQIESAVEYYLQAVSLDDSNINLWYRIGKVAIKIPNLNLAAYAFQEALRCNPNHWPSLDTLITVLYATGNYLLCLYYISEGLNKDSKYLKGLAFCKKIFNEHPSFIEDFLLYHPDRLLEERLNEYGEINIQDEVFVKMFGEADSLKKKFEILRWPNRNQDEVLTDIKPEPPLRKKSWVALGRSLLQVYFQLKKEYPEISFFRLVDLSVDEEKPEMEVDIDEIDELLEEQLIDNEVDKINETVQETEETLNRSKRRRSSPTLLEQWMPSSKRRSARVRSTVKRDEPTLARTLHNLLPQSLRPLKDSDNFRYSLDDSMDTMDMYRLFEMRDGDGGLQEIDPVSIYNNTNEDERKRLIEEQKYFNTNKEVEDIDLFIKENNCQNVLMMLNNYVRSVSPLWKLWWPECLNKIYLKIYKIIRLHSPENCQNSDSLDLLGAKSVILYGEILLDHWLNKGKDLGHPSPITGSVFGGEFSTLSFGNVNYVCYDTDDSELIIRSYWLESLMYLHAGNIDSTLFVLERYMDDERCKNIEVKLPNVKNHFIVNSDIIDRLFNTLRRNVKLEKVNSLFKEKRYESVIEILKDALQPKEKRLNVAFLNPPIDRCAQFSLLFESFFELEKYEDCFIWCEFCCYEAMNYCRNNSMLEDSSEIKSRWLSLLANALQAFPFCIDQTSHQLFTKLPENKLVRLIQTLSSVVCHQIDSTDSADIPFETISPWILLHEIIKHYEIICGKKVEDDEIPNSLILLFTAHEYLGKRSWCLNDDAEILFKTLTILLPIKEVSNPESDKMLILNQQMEQIFHCLFGCHIRKNSLRYVQKHNVVPLELTWSRSLLVYKFLKPSELPLYDSSIRFSISQEIEVLFKKITDLIPKDNNPSGLVEMMNNYIEGKSNELPSNKRLLPDDIVDIYYLIADYHFKNKTWKKAIYYYILDVCANPNRVDSWACLALAKGSQLETELNSCETIESELDFLKRAKMSCRCYKRSLQLDPEQSTLWIEYGSFSYTIHSFCKRILNREENLSLDLFEIVESQKDEMLETAYKCFTSANMLWSRLEKMGCEYEIQDERWLHHYMLGKISEKKEEQPTVYINHFLKSIKFLHKNNATYPLHISYSNPAQYSVESLELYYRVHACILKYLEQNEDKPLDENLRKFYFEVLEELACGPFPNYGKLIDLGYKTDDECNEEDIGDEDTDEDSEDDNSGTQNLKSDIPLVEKEVKFVLDDIISKIAALIEDTKENMNKRKYTDNLDAEVTEEISKKIKVENIEEHYNSVPSHEKITDVAESGLSNEIKMEITEEPCPEEPVKKSCTEGIVKDCNNQFQNLDQDDNKTKSQESSSESDSSSSDSTSSEDSSSSEESESSSSDSSKQETNSSDDKQLANKDTKKSLIVIESNWKEEQRCLIDRCLCAMKECVRRFPEHYKSLYRQANYYFRSKVRPDSSKVRSLLLDEGGLFADRKPNHFFCGVWRIPSNEIDRPGSFAEHMSRSLHLLLDLLRDSKDYKMMFCLSLQLKDTPEPDKKYLRDDERKKIAKESLSLCIQAIRRKLDEAHDVSDVSNVLNEAYKYYRRINKGWQQREGGFVKLVTQCFTKFLKSKGENNKYKCNFDAAIKFCKDGIFIAVPPPPPPRQPTPPPPITPPTPVQIPPAIKPDSICLQQKPIKDVNISTPNTTNPTLHSTSIVTSTVTTTTNSTFFNSTKKIANDSPSVSIPLNKNIPLYQSNPPLMPVKRPRGRPAGSSNRHPNPNFFKNKNFPSSPKDLQMFLKNLPYSPQQIMNFIAMQTAAASLSQAQQFNTAVQAELLKKKKVSQNSQRSPASSTVSSHSNVPTSLANSSKDNITITALGSQNSLHTMQHTSVNKSNSSKSVNKSQSSQSVKSVNKPMEKMLPLSKAQIPAISNSPIASQPPIVKNQTSNSVLNYSPLPPPTSLHHTLPPMMSGGSTGDMSLQQKLSAKRNKQLSSNKKDMDITNLRYDNKDTPAKNFNKNFMDMSKNIVDNRFPSLSGSSGLSISKVPTKFGSSINEQNKQILKDLTVSVGHDLSHKLSSLSPKEITLTRVPQNDSFLPNASGGSKNEQVSFADNTNKIPQKYLPQMSTNNKMPFWNQMLPSVDNRISALKSIGTQLTVTPSLGATIVDNKKQDNNYDKAEVTIVPKKDKTFI